MQPYTERRVLFENRVTLFIELFAEISHIDTQRPQRLPNGWSWFRASRWNSQIYVTNKRHAFEMRALLSVRWYKQSFFRWQRQANVWLLNFVQSNDVTRDHKKRQIQNRAGQSNDFVSLLTSQSRSSPLKQHTIRLAYLCMHHAYESEHPYGFNSNASTIFRRVAMTTTVDDKNVAARVHSGDADLEHDKIRYMLDKKKRYGEAWLKELGFEGPVRDRTLHLCDDDPKIYSSSDGLLEAMSPSTPTKTKKPSNLTIVVPPPVPVRDAATPPSTPFFTPESSAAGDPNTTPTRHHRSRPAVIMASRVSPARRHPHKYVKMENRVSNAVLVARHGSPMPSSQDFLNRIHHPAASATATRLRSPSVRNDVFSPRLYRSPSPSPPRQRLLLTDRPVMTATKFAKKRRLRSASCFLNVWAKPWTLWGRRRSRTTKKGVAHKA
jgi:hypothetical protein